MIDRPPVLGPSVLDALMVGDTVPAQIAGSVPHGLLVEALTELVPALVSADGRIDALIAVQRHIAMLHAQSTELLSALDAADTTTDQSTRDTVAAALRIPPAAMTSRMAAARDLAVQLPATLELLRAGDITHRHAAALVDATRALPPDTATAVETAVLARAPRHTTAQSRASIRRAVLHASDPVTEAAAHADTATGRRVVFHPTTDGMTGMTEVFAYLTAEDAALIKTTLDAIAHHTIHQPGGDDRTADQHRADALVDLARHTHTGHSPLTHPGPPCPTPAGTTRPASSDTASATAGGTTRPASSDTGGAAADGAAPACVELTPASSTEPVLPGFRPARGHGQRPAVQVTITASPLLGLDGPAGRTGRVRTHRRLVGQANEACA